MGLKEIKLNRIVTTDKEGAFETYQIYVEPSTVCLRLGVSLFTALRNWVLFLSIGNCDVLKAFSSVDKFGIFYSRPGVPATEEVALKYTVLQTKISQEHE